jgi:hypothetical protein
MRGCVGVWLWLALAATVVSAAGGGPPDTTDASEGCLAGARALASTQTTGFDGAVGTALAEAVGTLTAAVAGLVEGGGLPPRIYASVHDLPQLRDAGAGTATDGGNPGDSTILHGEAAVAGDTGAPAGPQGWRAQCVLDLARGLHLLHQMTAALSVGSDVVTDSAPHLLVAAVDAYAHFLELDPGDGLAWALLGGAVRQLPSQGTGSKLAARALATALRLLGDAAPADVHTELGFVVRGRCCSHACAGAPMAEPSAAALCRPALQNPTQTPNPPPPPRRPPPPPTHTPSPSSCQTKAGTRRLCLHFAPPLRSRPTKAVRG